jgi:hypothetical protein
LLRDDKKEAGMEVWETMQTAAALILAITAALMSSGPQARQEVSSYVAAVLIPQPIDFGDALDWRPQPAGRPGTEVALWRLPGDCARIRACTSQGHPIQHQYAALKQ